MELHLTPHTGSLLQPDGENRSVSHVTFTEVILKSQDPRHGPKKLLFLSQKTRPATVRGANVRLLYHTVTLNITPPTVREGLAASLLPSGPTTINE